MAKIISQRTPCSFLSRKPDQELSVDGHTVAKMGRIIFDTSTTFNGFIADESNSLDWLFEVDQSGLPEEGLVPLTASVLVEGSSTYEWILRAENLLAEPTKWQEFFGQKPTFVFTTRKLPIPDGADVRFVSGSVLEILPTIRAAANGGDIWVMGGGDLAGQFLDADALDEISLSVAPVSLPGGAPLFPRTIRADRLQLVSAAAYGQFARLVYAIKR